MSRIRTIKPEFWRPVSQWWNGHDCHLYLVQEGEHGAIKIGVAAHPTRRLSSLQCGNKRRLHLKAVYGGTRKDCLKVERAVLQFYNGDIDREWITCDLEGVVRTIGRLAEVIDCDQ
jgi:hypothetical protein